MSRILITGLIFLLRGICSSTILLIIKGGFVGLDPNAPKRFSKLLLGWIFMSIILVKLNAGWSLSNMCGHSQKATSDTLKSKNLLRYCSYCFEVMVTFFFMPELNSPANIGCFSSTLM